MAMIVIHHMLINSIYSVPEILETEGSIDILKGSAIILNSFCYVGVNCFILISGFYGIKFKIRGLLKLYFFCVFYFLLPLIFGETSITKDSLLHAIFPFSTHHNKWFIPCYFILYLFAPLLNKAIENLKKNEFILVLITLTVANIYYGYIWKQSFNFNGYNEAQFIYIYVIAGYIRRFVDLSKVSQARSLSTYFIFALIFGILAIATHYIKIPFYRSFAYNNPLLIIASIFFFIFFRNLNYKNSYVNWAASSSLAIYLLPELPIRNSLSAIILQQNNAIVAIGFLVLMTFIYAFTKVIIAIVLDKLRIYFFENPLFILIDKIHIKSPNW
jgi:surface polysaccharide O-acyltransferase-like enzyme